MNKVIPMRLKHKFYRSVLGTIMLNGLEKLAVAKRIDQSMSIVEMDVLRWMVGMKKRR